LSDEQEIRDAVDAAKARGTFNIIDVLQGRGYPKTSVEVYLNETAIYKISEIREELEALDKKVSTKKETEKDKALREELISQEALTMQEIIDSGYTVELMGIPEGKREELYRSAVKKYPIEYLAEKNMSSILTGNSSKEEKESPERDALFTDFLWQEHLQKIIDKDENEQAEFSYVAVREMRNSFPLNAIIAINGAIEKLRTSTAVFTMETGEDFLAKP
jgi:hypothetical protein